jgi:hypothetical protein
VLLHLRDFNLIYILFYVNLSLKLLKNKDMEKINVAVVGQMYSEAMILITLLQNMPEINLIPESIGNTDNLDFILSKTGINGKEIKIFPIDKIEIFLKYKNLIVVDFKKENRNIDFYIKNNIRYIIPDEKKTESIIKLILLP